MLPAKPHRIQMDCRAGGAEGEQGWRMAPPPQWKNKVRKDPVEGPYTCKGQYESSLAHSWSILVALAQRCCPCCGTFGGWDTNEDNVAINPLPPCTWPDGVGASNDTISAPSDTPSVTKPPLGLFWMPTSQPAARLQRQCALPCPVPHSPPITPIHKPNGIRWPSARQGSTSLDSGRW